MATAALVSQIITFTGATSASPVFAEQQQQKQQFGGLYASYYLTPDFFDAEMTMSKLDAGGHLTPDGLEDALFNPIKSARWQGQIKPVKEGDYKFSTSYNQQVMMNVDGVRVLMQGEQKSVHLKAGQSYDVVLEYKNEAGIQPEDFKFDLSWAIGNGSPVLIPKAELVRDVQRPEALPKSLFDTPPVETQTTEETKTTNETPTTTETKTTEINANTNGWVTVAANKQSDQVFKGLYTLVYSNADFYSPEATLLNAGFNLKDTAMQKDVKAVRWLGEIKPKQTGKYTFSVTPPQSAGEARLAIDGTRYIQNSQTAETAEVELEAGKSYPIVIEYKNADGLPISKMFTRFAWKSENSGGRFVTVPDDVIVRGTEKPTVPTKSLFDASYADSPSLSSGGTYYYENGKKVTGLKEINGQTYYFNADGVMQTGVQKVNNKSLYFYSKKQGDHPVGSQCKGTDFVEIDTQHTAYVQNGVVQTGEIHLNNKMLIADAKGVLQSGWQTIGTKKYYIEDQRQGVIKGSSVVVDGKRYGFNLDGTVIENGVLSLGTFKANVTDIQAEVQGTIAKTYVFENGVAKIGPGLPSSGAIDLVKIPNTILKEHLQDDGLLVILSDEVDNQKIPHYAEKKLYYYGSDTKKFTGWKTIGSDKYYFNPTDGGAAVTGVQTIDNQEYLFDGNGKLQEHVVRQTGE